MATIQRESTASRNEVGGKSRSKMSVLELARGAAALWVVLFHCAEATQARSGFWKILASGGRAPVMFFFVLSGFVIGLTHIDRKEPFSSYLRSRTARIYPVFLIALVATAFIPPVRSVATPGIFIANLFMLQGPRWEGVRGCFYPFGCNAPLWSLSFEWWFYIAFFWLKTKWPTVASRVVFAGSILGTAAYLVVPFFPFLWLSFFGVWWSGIELARQYSKQGSLSFKGQRTSLSVLAGAILLAICYLLAIARPAHMDVSSSESLIRALLFSTFFLVLSICASSKLSLDLGRWEKIALALGGASYALYATHYLVVRTVFGLNLPLWKSLGLVFICCILIALGIERFLQPLGAGLIRAVWPKSKAPLSSH